MAITVAALQVKGKWRAQYARYGNKGILALGVLMALTGTALILAGMQQPKASVILPGGGTGPSRNELRAGVLQQAGKAGKQKGSLTSGCPMLRVPKVTSNHPCTCTHSHAARAISVGCLTAVQSDGVHSPHTRALLKRLLYSNAAYLQVVSSLAPMELPLGYGKMRGDA